MDVRGTEPPARPTSADANGGEGEDPTRLAVTAEASSRGSRGSAFPRARALAEVHLERLKILVVEDDLFSAEAIRELCRLCNFDAEIKHSGAECLQVQRPRALSLAREAPMRAH